MHEEPMKRRMVCSSADLIDAKLETHKICGSVQCPSCGHTIDRKPDWFGLPAGVKFDPTDQELIDHLEAKVCMELSNSHPLIDEFIPTIDGEDGICYTHPEKLPGVTRDGLSKHFFHRPSKAYTTGTRKRRKIQTDCNLHRGETRWHKTGKTRPVMVCGMQKGCKKILVLYTNFGKHRKPQKTNWVMHQYHLGELEEEKDGELVVSKIFFQTQPRQCNWPEKNLPPPTVFPAAGDSSDQRRDRSSASCSSKEVVSQRDELNSATAGASVFRSFDIHRVTPENFTFSNFRKSFEEVGVGEAQPSPPRLTLPLSLPLTTTMMQQESNRNQRQQQKLCDEKQQLQLHSSPMTSFSLSPATIPHTAMLLDDPFHVSRLLQNQHHQQIHQQQSQFIIQQQQKLLERSNACLEELIMGCNPSAKRDAALPHSQETEWQYSYWMPDTHDHHR